MPAVSLRRQLILWNALTLMLLLAILGMVTRFTAASTIMRSVDQHLEERARPPHGGPHPGGPRPGEFLPPGNPPSDGSPPNGNPPGDGSPPDHGPPPENSSGEYHLRFFDSHGQPRTYPYNAAWDQSALASGLQGRKVFSTVTVAGVSLRVLTQPTPNGALQAAYPLDDVNHAIAGLDRALLLLIPVALLAAGLSGAALTARVLRPVRQITQAAADMGETLSARLPVQGEDEFAQMADTFNDLLERLDASFHRQARHLEQQRRFTADASHELKTPLTVIQGNANQIGYGGLADEEQAQAIAEITHAAESMARLVQDLLLLARSDEEQVVRKPITILVREVLTQAVSRVSQNSPAISLRMAEEDMTLCGNEEELIRLFANLLQNAVRFTPPNGNVTVEARRQGKNVVVTVADTGVGIAPEHLPHLGERFYRVDSARARRDGGTGLGISICRSIVEAHGGTLAFASIPGQGTIVTVTLGDRYAEKQRS